MSVLIIQLPARPRLRADADASSGSGLADEWQYAYVLSRDGETVARQGEAPAAQLPRATSVIAVMDVHDVSWHRVTLPKAPASRLLAALTGMLEESLLAEPEDVHLAVAPEPQVGQPTWVAVCDNRWLTSHLMAFEKAKLRVARVVPSVWPDAPSTGYVRDHAGDGSQSDVAPLSLTWSSLDGVMTWPLQGGLARALLPYPLPEESRFFATPAVATQTERWLGRSVEVQTEAEHLLQATRSLWNLLQFDLTPRSKGVYALQDRWRQWMSPAWRPVRVGVLALLAIQIVGLNAWSWHLTHQVKAKQQEMSQLLRQTYPQVQAVLDAPIQMQRETANLRAAAGQPGEDDLESLMGAVAAAWPAGQPTKSLEYDGRSVTLATPAGWGPQQLQPLKNRLQGAGLVLDVDEAQGRLVIHRAARG